MLPNQSRGLGLFDSNNPMQWSMPEWLTLAFGAYGLYFALQMLGMGAAAAGRKAASAGRSASGSFRRTFGRRTIHYRPKRARA